MMSICFKTMWDLLFPLWLSSLYKKNQQGSREPSNIYYIMPYDIGDKSFYSNITLWKIHLCEKVQKAQEKYTTQYNTINTNN